MNALALALALAASPTADTAPIQCGSCPEWNAAQAPFHIHGNTWYVGPRGLSALLLDSGRGLVLLDGALPQSAPDIVRNLQALGFEIGDVEWILLSHAHFDHAGGIAALARMSGAKVGASPAAAAALRAGTVMPDDPQSGYGDSMAFPPVGAVVEIGDGESIELGELHISAVHTPGHTPGGSSWTWRSCEDADCVTVVYADSLTAVSAPDYRYSDHPANLAAFRRSIQRIAGLDCDLLVSTHPEFVQLWQRKAIADATDGSGAYLDADACRDYADAAAEGLRRRLEHEGAAPRS